MKKMSKLVMAAILAVALQGTAMAALDAQVDLNDVDSAANGAGTFASELLVINPATGADTDVITTSERLSAKTTLGFGCSKTQQRYLRFDLAGAKFNTPITAAALNSTNSSDDMVIDVALSSGGAKGDTFVIFHITALQDLQPSQVFTVKFPDVEVTNKADTTTLQYRVYEFAEGATTPTTGLNQNRSPLPFIKYASGISFATTPITSAVDVADLYTDFTDETDGSLAKAPIGKATWKVDTAVLDKAGAALTNDAAGMGLFVAANTKLNLTGQDFSAAKVDGIYTSTTTDCTKVTALTKISNTQYDFTLGTDPFDKFICFETASPNTVEIAEQTFKAGITVDKASGTETANQAEKTIGYFEHDGTVLRAPFTEKSAFINLANMSEKLPAPYAVKCVGPKGTFDGAGNTIPAGQTVKLWPGQLCVSPDPVNAIEFIMAVPQGQVVGSFVRQNLTTGDTGADGLIGNQIKPTQD